jgi:hypothetical protein
MWILGMCCTRIVEHVLAHTTGNYIHGYLHGHCVLHVIKYRERAHNTHLHIVCRILCILTRPREIYKNNIPLTRKIREIEKMYMEILATVCIEWGYKT